MVIKIFTKFKSDMRSNGLDFLWRFPKVILNSVPVEGNGPLKEDEASEDEYRKRLA